VPHREADYFYGDDIATCLEIIRSDELLGLIAGETVAIR
jgi:hypothetical protein